MIGIDFRINNSSEAKATNLFQKLGYLFNDETARLLPFPFVPSMMDCIYQRTGTKSGEPAVELINRGLEHYIRASAHPTDRAAHSWLFRLQCSEHIIAVDQPGVSRFHILKSEEVSTLFQSLAQKISKLVDGEVSYDDDHTHHTVTFRNGTPTKDEHW